jgi:hypothetical protein
VDVPATPKSVATQAPSAPAKPETKNEKTAAPEAGKPAATAASKKPALKSNSKGQTNAKTKTQNSGTQGAADPKNTPPSKSSNSSAAATQPREVIHVPVAPAKEAPAGEAKPSEIFLNIAFETLHQDNLQEGVTNVALAVFLCGSEITGQLDLKNCGDMGTIKKAKNQYELKKGEPGIPAGFGSMDLSRSLVEEAYKPRLKQSPKYFIVLDLQGQVNGALSGSLGLATYVDLAKVFRTGEDRKIQIFNNHPRFFNKPLAELNLSVFSQQN